MRSKTATSAFSSSITRALALALGLLLAPHPAPLTPVLFAAPDPAALARAERLHRMLIAQGILAGTVLTWEGREYDVSRRYMLCEAYGGICYKAYEAGFPEPVVLAIYEIAPGELAMQPVDYLKYRKDRSADAARYYRDATGLPEAKVLQRTTPAGAPMFDMLGQLTKAGEAAYTAETEGGGGVPAAPAKDGTKATEARKAAETKKAAVARKGAKKKKGVGKANAAVSKYSVRQLGAMGYREISRAELDCLHTVPFDDSELILEKVQEADRIRFFLHPKDPAIMIAMLYRRDRVCNPQGTKIFGKQ